MASWWRRIFWSKKKKKAAENKMFDDAYEKAKREYEAREAVKKQMRDAALEEATREYEKKRKEAAEASKKEQDVAIAEQPQVEDDAERNTDIPSNNLEDIVRKAVADIGTITYSSTTGSRELNYVDTNEEKQQKAGKLVADEGNGDKIANQWLAALKNLSPEEKNKRIEKLSEIISLCENIDFEKGYETAGRLLKVIDESDLKEGRFLEEDYEREICQAYHEEIKTAIFKKAYKYNDETKKFEVINAQAASAYNNYNTASEAEKEIRILRKESLKNEVNKLREMKEKTEEWRFGKSTPDEDLVNNKIAETNDNLVVKREDHIIENYMTSKNWALTIAYKKGLVSAEIRDSFYILEEEKKKKEELEKMSPEDRAVALKEMEEETKKMDNPTEDYLTEFSQRVNAEAAAKKADSSKEQHNEEQKDDKRAKTKEQMRHDTKVAKAAAKEKAVTDVTQKEAAKATAKAEKEAKRQNRAMQRGNERE